VDSDPGRGSYSFYPNQILTALIRESDRPEVWKS
jgi:hypothetical protein